MEEVGVVSGRGGDGGGRGGRGGGKAVLEAVVRVREKAEEQAARVPAGSRSGVGDGQAEQQEASWGGAAASSRKQLQSLQDCRM